MSTYAAEWFAKSDVIAAEMRAGAKRSRLGSPQRLHRHSYGSPCTDRCEDVPTASEPSEAAS